MKAGLAANMAVARTLHASGITLERPFAVHTVISEEDGGLGAFATMLRGHTGDAAVITEPTSGRIVTANAGALTFTLTVPGRAAHGSMRLEGVNALDAFLPIYRRLRELETERNAHPDTLFGKLSLPYPISVGRVSAGDWASSVPDILVAEGRMGVQLGEDPAAARAAFEAAVRDTGSSDPWLRDNPAVVSWPGGQFASGRLATTTRSSTRSQPPSPTCLAARARRGQPHRTEATCACTRESAESPACTTVRAMCGSRTRHESRSTWPRSSAWPVRFFSSRCDAAEATSDPARTR